MIAGGGRRGGGERHAHPTVCGNRVRDARHEGDGSAAAAHYPGGPRAVVARRGHATAEDGPSGRNRWHRVLNGADGGGIVLDEGREGDRLARCGSGRGDNERNRCVRKRARGGELRGFAGGGGLEGGANKLFGEDVPACGEIAVLVGDHGPRFERLLDGICFDHNHVHSFAGLEPCAGEIDIGIWRVILAIGGKGWAFVRRVGALGTLGGLVCNALLSQIKYLRGARFVQLLRRNGRSTQVVFGGCRWRLGGLRVGCAYW